MVNSARLEARRGSDRVCGLSLLASSSPDTARSSHVQLGLHNGQQKWNHQRSVCFYGETARCSDTRWLLSVGDGIRRCLACVYCCAECFMSSPAPGAPPHLGPARTWCPPAPGARPHLGPAYLVMGNLLREEKHEVGFYSSGSLVYLSLFSFIEA